ncbi:copper chaperone PCu(A)C [Hansschlegelia quercus]|uniref:Copper chaperone PCu(A)C n=2 Tax=Hansschlegelia quercus TaxID=2528245 RepID=A0A4Q9GU28_9HYPH|nr:copper chaperone PCu(A)C [Hansschlegelia quercus]TBN55337.1 copper chaperone PCu(A)C [Hansschlegelia quercus]
MIYAAILSACALTLVSPASAHEYKLGDLTIGHPWSRATPPGAKVGGGFLTIENKGSTPDRLVAVSASFAQKAEMHETLTEDGVSKMRPLKDGVEVKPGETVTFEPGGKHLMFIGLAAPLKQGDRAKGELTFEKAGKVDVEFAVEAAGSSPKKQMDGDMKGMDHGSMDHSGMKQGQ